MFDASTDSEERFSLLEMDSPTAHRKTAPPEQVEVIDLDLTDGKSKTTHCLACDAKGIPVNEHSICEACFAGLKADYDRALIEHIVEASHPQTQEDIVPEYASDSVEALAAELTQASALATANAAVQGIGSMRTGEMEGVGWRTQDGYITAIRNGVPARTHAEYISVLRNRFKLSTTAIAKLNLPGPMAVTALPVGEGIKHIPTGPSIFDRPRAERAFVVGPKAEVQEKHIVRQISGQDLIAGAVAEGHHAIVAWEGTSGMQRGDLVKALESIGRQAWAPSAPNARAQAGSAIAALSRGGLHVKPLRKGSIASSGMASGEHTWTVGRVSHTGQVGDDYGEVVVRFRLKGAELTYEGSSQIAEPVLATFAARMAAEQYKSGDVTSWLGRTIRWKLDGVRFGALGWLVPAANVAAATELCKAIQGAGFGSGWVTGLPVATSDQLRDGIVQSLIDEVTEAIDKLAAERQEAADAKDAAIAAANDISHKGGDNTLALDAARKLTGDIGEKRAHTYLKEFKAIGERVVAYGAVLGEQRVDKAQQWIKRAMGELETIVGEDFTGIRERFGLIWEEIERDRKASGGVL